MSVFKKLGANFGQKTCAGFCLFLEKCVDAKLLRLVEKNPEISAKCVEDRIPSYICSSLTI